MMHAETVEKVTPATEPLGVNASISNVKPCTTAIVHTQHSRGTVSLNKIPLKYFGRTVSLRQF